VETEKVIFWLPTPITTGAKPYYECPDRPESFSIVFPGCENPKTGGNRKSHSLVTNAV
jgi:hypothetical protein